MSCQNFSNNVKISQLLLQYFFNCYCIIFWKCCCKMFQMLFQNFQMLLQIFLNVVVKWTDGLEVKRAFFGVVIAGAWSVQVRHCRGHTMQSMQIYSETRSSHRQSFRCLIFFLIKTGNFQKSYITYCTVVGWQKKVELKFTCCHVLSRGKRFASYALKQPKLFKLKITMTDWREWVKETQ